MAAKLGALNFFGDAAPPAPPPPPAAPADKPPTATHTAESAALARKHLGVRVEAAGATPPPPWAGWRDGGLDARVAAALPRGGWPAPTPVQAQCAPVLLAGRDALVVAPTGCGKTGAFLVPALHAAISSRGKRATLIAAPTRELVAQLAREARRWLDLCGAADLKVATAPFAPGDAPACIAVATPVQLLPLAARQPPALLVLDEADRLFDASGGFLREVDALLAGAPAACRCLASATAPGPFLEAAAAALHPTRCVVRVAGGGASDDRAAVAQRFVFTGDDDRSKTPALRELIREGACAPPCLIFANCAARTKSIAARLLAAGLRADVLSAAERPAERARALRNFRAGATWFLVATDVASRGLDLPALACVVSYDAPTQPADYVHRVGRAGRRGRAGAALTLYTSDDAPRLRAVAKAARRAGCADVPSFLAADVPRSAWDAANEEGRTGGPKRRRRPNAGAGAE